MLFFINLFKTGIFQFRDFLEKVSKILAMHIAPVVVTCHNLPSCTLRYSRSCDAADRPAAQAACDVTPCSLCRMAWWQRLQISYLAHLALCLLPVWYINLNLTSKPTNQILIILCAKRKIYQNTWHLTLGANKESLNIFVKGDDQLNNVLFEKVHKTKP